MLKEKLFLTIVKEEKLLFEEESSGEGGEEGKIRN